MFRFSLCLILCFFCQLVAQEKTAVSIIKNDSIAIHVTNTELEKGRFSIETTGGDPSRKNDDTQPLIYGRPKPWTSYTTFQINGQSYVFGGTTKKRAGKSAKFGEVLSQVVSNNVIVTRVRFKELDVTQHHFFETHSVVLKIWHLLSTKFRIEHPHPISWVCV